MIAHIERRGRSLASTTRRRWLVKNILLLVHHDAGQEARLQAALDITRAVGGHLACIDVTPFPVVAGNAVMGSGDRSEERRVGKECVSTCRSRWSPYH